MKVKGVINNTQPYSLTLYRERM